MFLLIYLSFLSLGARFLVTSFKSCNFLPNSSSFATNSISFSSPNELRTDIYIPIATDGEPFSTFTSVALLIPARSGISSLDKPLRKQSVKSDGVINLFSDVGGKVFQMPPHNPEVQAYP